jgi:predicted enzyme related to lactoylglutathione lyase
MVEVRDKTGGITVLVRAVDFVGVPVPDMEKGQAFYRDVLGLAPLSEDRSWSEYDAGNMTVSLFMEEGMTASPTTRNALLALAVEDMAAALAEVTGKGASLVQETEEYSVCYMATIADPFGNQIILHQRKDGTAG